MNWIISVRLGDRSMRRFAVVGPARQSTVEALLDRAQASDSVREAIRANPIVRSFVEDILNPERTGYYVPSEAFLDAESWLICIGPVHEVLAP